MTRQQRGVVLVLVGMGLLVAALGLLPGLLCSLGLVLLVVGLCP